jgi:hypothetical protein
MSRPFAWIAVLASPFLACVQVGTSTGSGTDSTGGTSSGTTASSSGDASTAATGCATDPQTGLTLCLAIAACPNISIDQGAFPTCGFRQGGVSEFDVECLCNGTELCPLGAPASCSDVTTLLAQEMSALVVCEQVSSGTCILQSDAGASSSGSSGGGSGSGSGGSSTQSSACQTCTANCGGTPACYQACGC